MSEASASSDDVDALFKLPLAEFTGARNALAAQLKKAGRQAEADEVKALAKPSVSAWVVNQLYWRHRELFDRLLEAGNRLRRAQGSQATSDSAREPIIARREAVTALVDIAAQILRDGNHGATHDLVRRVTSTLEALSSYGSLPDAPGAGRLTADLEPPGFDAVASLFPGTDKRTASVTQLPARSSRAAPMTNPARREQQTDRRGELEHKGLVTAAKVAVQEAERALSVARKQAKRAAATLDAAAARAKALEGERARIEKRLVQASRDAAAAQQRASDAATSAKEATQAAEAAGRTLELARRQLQQVE